MTPEEAWEATGQLECLDEDVGAISITRAWIEEANRRKL